MDRGAWQAAVYGVAKSWTQLSDFTSLDFTSRIAIIAIVIITIAIIISVLSCALSVVLVSF